MVTIKHARTKRTQKFKETKVKEQNQETKNKKFKRKQINKSRKNKKGKFQSSNKMLLVLLLSGLILPLNLMGHSIGIKRVGNDTFPKNGNATWPEFNTKATDHLNPDKYSISTRSLLLTATTDLLWQYIVEFGCCAAHLMGSTCSEQP